MAESKGAGNEETHVEEDLQFIIPLFIKASHKTPHWRSAVVEIAAEVFSFSCKGEELAQKGSSVELNKKSFY